MVNETALNPSKRASKAHNTFKIRVRDVSHFYKLVRGLNNLVGKGKDKWTMSGRPLRRIKKGDTPFVIIYVFTEGIDDEISLFLSLL